MLNQKIPPQNIEAEQALIISVLINDDSLVKIRNIVEPRDFYREAHQIIFGACLELSRKHEPVDLVTLSNLLKLQGTLEKVGGEEYLGSLLDAASTSAGAPYYAQIVKECADRRRLICVCLDTARQAHSGDLDELTGRIKAEVRTISGISKTENFDSSGMIHSAFKGIEQKHATGNRTRGVLTGFEAVDYRMRGLARGESTILGARPNIGKTALTLNTADFISDNYPEMTVLYFNLESSSELLTLRRLAAHSGQSFTRLQTGEIENWDTLTKSCGALSEKKNLKLISDTRKFGTIEAIADYCEMEAMEHNISIIIIDHLQLVRTKQKTFSDNDRLSLITQRMANIALELKTHVLGLSQLNRAVEARTNKKPTMFDFRDSGTIEQNADNLLALWKPDPESEIVKIGMLKGRSIRGWWEADLLFKQDHQRFYDVA